GRRAAKDAQSGMDQAKESIKDVVGARILLVEDNDMNQLVASRILGNAGFLVTIAREWRGWRP
ncbi:MAG: hypothetical protein LBS60_03765, partial [Deltaproteobacteria bacterium]|nr:hypothetical protein [Deltaproteobacteria bacterium]